MVVLTRVSVTKRTLPSLEPGLQAVTSEGRRPDPQDHRGRRDVQPLEVT